MNDMLDFLTNCPFLEHDVMPYQYQIILVWFEEQYVQYVSTWYYHNTLLEDYM